jgi:hypothetical protein
MVGDDDSDPAEPGMIGILSAESPPLSKIVEIDFINCILQTTTKIGFSLMLLYTATLVTYHDFSTSC